MTPTGSGTGTPITVPGQNVPGFYKADYREAIARVFGYFEGTAESFGATENRVTLLIDPTLRRFADDYFNGNQIDCQGATSWITDFGSATGTLMFSPGVLASEANTEDTAYRIYQRVTKEDIDDAIGMACAGYEVATSLVPKTDSLDYYITGVKLLQRRQQIIGVWVRVHNDVRNPPVEVQGWQLEEAEGLLTFRMPYLLNKDDSVWLSYYAAEHSISDDEWLPLPIALVRARAVVYLMENKLNSVIDRDWYGTQLRYWTEKLRQEEAKFERAAKRVKLEPWQLGEATARDGWDSSTDALRTY